jgi:hypothetical protein
MARRFLPVLVLLLTFAWIAAYAQQPLQGEVKKDGPKKEEPAKKEEARKDVEPGPAPGPAPVAPPKLPEFEARFADDSLVRLTILDPNITVVTRYGKLTIPVAEIRKLDLGFRYPEGVEAKIDAAIANLGASQFKAREEASQALVGYKELAVPSLRRATRSTDAEVKRRAEDILKKLGETGGSDALSLPDYDVVDTADFPVRGRIETGSIRVRTKYFGEVPLQIAELRILRSVGAAGRNMVTIEAPNPPTALQWVDSGIDVMSDRPLEFRVSGQMTLRANVGGAGPAPAAFGGAPAGAFVGNQLTFGPNGSSEFGVRSIPLANGQFAQVQSGALLGRIGNSNVIHIGLQGRLDNPPAGRLWLAVAPLPSGRSGDLSGSFRVNVGDGNLGVGRGTGEVFDGGPSRRAADPRGIRR